MINVRRATPRLVRLKLRKPFHTGQTEIVLDPLDFLRRLVATIPPNELRATHLGNKSFEFEYLITEGDGRGLRAVATVNSGLQRLRNAANATDPDRFRQLLHSFDDLEAWMFPAPSLPASIYFFITHHFYNIRTMWLVFDRS